MKLRQIDNKVCFAIRIILFVIEMLVFRIFNGKILSVLIK
jgi:hypothetical protein